MTDLVIAFSLGLLSAPHCFAMCGSIASALVMSGQKIAHTHNTPVPVSVWPSSQSAQMQHPLTAASATSDALVYATGKLFTYAALGFFAGSASGLLTLLGPLPGILMRGASAVLMIAIGLYIARWWQGISRLEVLANKLWQPALNKLRHLQLNSIASKLLAGAIWGLLPCGIVYSMLGLALSSGTPLQGMALMASFGLGTLPFVIGTGSIIGALGKVLANTTVRHTAGVIIIILGLISLVVLVKSHTGHSAMPQHQIILTSE